MLESSLGTSAIIFFVTSWKRRESVNDLLRERFVALFRTVREKNEYLGNKVVECHDRSSNIKRSVKGKGDVVSETIVSSEGWLGYTFLVIARCPVAILHDELVVRVEGPVVVEVEGDEAEHREVEVHIPPPIHSCIIVLSFEKKHGVLLVSSH